MKIGSLIRNTESAINIETVFELRNKYWRQPEQNLFWVKSQEDGGMVNVDLIIQDYTGEYKNEVFSYISCIILWNKKNVDCHAENSAFGNFDKICSLKIITAMKLKLCFCTYFFTSGLSLLVF